MTRQLLVLMTLTSWLMVGRPARADVTAAAKAFSDAQTAQVAGKYALAAEKFELAHKIMPSAAALRSAARMRLEAEHLATAATHADELLERYSDDAESKAVADEVLKRVGDELTRIEVGCSQPCTVSVDGKAVGIAKQTAHRFYTRPGTKTVEAWFEPNRSTSKQIEAVAGEHATLTLQPPAPEPTPTEPEPKPERQAVVSVPERAQEPAVKASNGLHPAWFYTGLALTAAAGGVSVWSGLETQSLREDFDDHPTQEAYDEGVDSQRRTNILLGATGAVGLTTVILALVTDWDEPTAERPVAISPLGVWGRF